MGTNKSPVLLAVPPNARSLIEEHYEGAAAALGAYFELAPWPPANWDDAKGDAKHAEAIAKALEGVVHSSDTDFDYVPCVLHGVDLKKGLFAALGIKKTDRFSVGGYDNAKLTVTAASKKHPPLRLMAHLVNDDTWAELDEYVEQGDQQAYAKAAKALESVGDVVGVCLCANDGATKLVFTMAKAASGAWSGVLAVRTET